MLIIITFTKFRSFYLPNASSVLPYGCHIIYCVGICLFTCVSIYVRGPFICYVSTYL
jgi:hypothetical protein